jgi:hypothetical protein
MPECTRSLACKMKKHTSKSTTGSPVHAGFPRAIGFNGLLRALPGVRDVLVTVISAMQSIVANLTPAKGRQDHTTSPSALMPLVLRHDQRPSHPALNVRDAAYAPLVECGTRRVKPRLLIFRKKNIFARATGQPIQRLIVGRISIFRAAIFVMRFRARSSEIKRCICPSGKSPGG